MYFIALQSSVIWQGKPLTADLVSKIPFSNQRAWYSAWYANEPLAQAPELEFSILSQAPLVDNYRTWVDIDIFSERLIRTLKVFGVKFEAFSVRIIDRQTGLEMPAAYSAFHLLETLDGVDRKQSVIEYGVGTTIHKLVLTAECTRLRRPFFRLEGKGMHFFSVIRSDLHDELVANRITGYTFIPLDEFQSGKKYFLDNLLK